MNFKLHIDGLKEFQQGLDILVRHKIPQAVVNALNATAFGAREAEQREIAASFTGPVPRMLRSPLYRKADLNNRSVDIEISEKEFPGKTHRTPMDVLRPHVFGGGRSVKASERSLRARHQDVFGSGQFITPGPGAMRDQYGNIPSGEMIKILSGAGLAEHSAGYQMNITARSRKRNKGAYGNLFVSPRVGVFRRLGPNSVVPVLYFTRSTPKYAKRYAFHAAFVDHVQKNFLKNLVRSWGSVMFKGGLYGR
jgi:hypothetical protein